MRPESLRVAMITRLYLPGSGGEERIISSLAAGLATQGVELHILTEHNGQSATIEQLNQVYIHRVRLPKIRAVAWPLLVLNYLRLIRQLRPQIIHAHRLTHSSSTPAIIAKWLFRIPVIVTVHSAGKNFGDIIRIQRTRYRSIYFALLRRVIDRYIGVTAQVTQELIKAQLPAQRCRTIANSIDVEHFKPVSPEDRSALKQHFGWPTGPIVIYTGRLASAKRIDRLIEVWPKINQVQPAAALIIVGDGPEADRLKRSANATVIFTGRVEDVQRYLQAADIFVLPSAAEGLSLAMLEAMAVGLAPIVTRVGGAADIIEDQVNGLLIPIDDAVALQTALLTLLADADRRDRLGRAAHDRVKQTYSIQRMIDQTLEVYQDLI